LFEHALVQDAAYGTLLKGARQKLHNRIARMLEERLPDRASAHPELVANHYAQAGASEKAIEYWDKAGRLAVGRSMMAEAAVHFGKALRLVASLPKSTWRQTSELALQLALAGTLMAAKGWASFETGRAYSRARELCRGAPPQLAIALNGAWSYLHNCADIRSAHQLADEIVALSERGRNRETKLIAHRCLGTSYLFLGKFHRALDHLGRALTFYDRDEHRPPALAPYDIRVAIESFVAWTLLLVGQADQALAQSRHALAYARAVLQP
jgi:predicted ATPase